MRWARAFGWIAAISCTPGCTASLGEPPPAPTDVTDATPDTELRAVYAPVHRLAIYEFQNTLSDLFVDLEITGPSLPSDPELHGFTNDVESLSVSELHVRRFLESAVAYGRAATRPDYMSTLLPCETWRAIDEQDACIDLFLDAFVARAFRRPPDPQWMASLKARTRGWRDAIDFDGAIETAIVAVLMSADFLYRVDRPSATEATIVDLHSLANRMSYAAWGSMPDAPLFDRAADGSLALPETRLSETDRLQENDRARKMSVRLHRAWLGLDEFLDPTHQTRLAYPGWDSRIQLEGLEAIERFFEYLYDNDPTLGGFFLDRTAFITPRLSQYYDIPVDAAAEFEQVTLSENERAGILTRLPLLAMRSHASYPSPPLRGSYLRERILCAPLLNPPADANLTQPEAKEEDGPQTNRALFEARSASPACRGCHLILDGLGFGFEQYDEAGVFREHEDELEINATGLLLGTDVDGPFTGALELSERLAESDAVAACYVKRMVQAAFGQALGPQHEATITALTHAFQRDSANTRSLLRSTLLHPDFRSYGGTGP